MRIISKYKDYYDGGGHGMVDKSIVYLRKEENIPYDNKTDMYGLKKQLNDIGKYYYKLKDKSISYIDSFIVGFCGKQYVGYGIYRRTKNQFTEELTITYDIDELSNLFSNPKDIEYIIEKHKYILNKNCIDVFHTLNTPIYLYEFGGIVGYRPNKNRNQITINPNLKEYEFYLVFDTYSAFQEISMFVGGVLTNNPKNDIVVSDKTKIESKGFDYKHSFRNTR